LLYQLSYNSPDEQPAQDSGACKSTSRELYRTWTKAARHEQHGGVNEFSMTASRYLIGFHAVAAQLRQRAEGVQAIYITAARQDRRAREIVELAQSLGIDVHAVDDARLAQLADGEVHQGVVAQVQGELLRQTVDEVLDALTTPPLLLLLDGVTDPHNLGACLRSADAFGVDAVIIPKDRAVGVNATVAKVASGAVETVPVITVINLARTMRELKERGVWLVGGDAEGSESLFDADLSGPIAWVLGGEGSGLRRLTRELCDRSVSIPLMGSVASLNVSVAAGICLYATRQQRSRASG
jgi:23S rRNA (guanosine2251-2'-O)-methyltransferase